MIEKLGDNMTDSYKLSPRLQKLSDKYMVAEAIQAERNPLSFMAKMRKMQIELIEFL